MHNFSMSIKFSHFNLITKDKGAIANFFAQVFDAELQDDFIEFAGTRFKLIEKSAPDLSTYVDHIAVNLKVDSNEELQMISQKAHFCDYRSGDQLEKNPEKAQLHRVGDEEYADISDPDGRIWRISYIIPD